MPQPKTLRVLARGSAMVQDYEALENPYGGTRRYLGRPHDPKAGELVEDPDTKQKKPQGGFVAIEGMVVEAPNRVEYRNEIRRHEGLWAADEATAQACEVPFDPSFGGEHDPKLVAAGHAKLDADLGKPPKKDASPAAAAKGA
jgi:hypothetical protein